MNNPTCCIFLLVIAIVGMVFDVEFLQLRLPDYPVSMSEISPKTSGPDL